VRRLLTTLALVLPGGFAVAAVSAYASLYSAARSGDPDVDRLRSDAILALGWVFGLKLSRAIVQAFVAGVLANERASREGDARYGDAHFPRGRAGYYPIGDVTARLGPAVGPGQVLAGLHLARLGFTGDPLELAQVGNELRALYYAARIFREAYDAAGGDLRETLRRYNGSPTFDGDHNGRPDAYEYADRALGRIAELGAVA
jgi:hypothetical protein